MGGRGSKFRSGSDIRNERVRNSDRYSDGMVGLDYEGRWRDALFSSGAQLYKTIAKGDNGRYDILSRNMNGGEFGNITFMDSYGDDNIAYTVYFQRSYANPDNPSEIRIIRFEEEEWRY